MTESPFGPDALDPDCKQMESRSRFVPRHVVDELFALIDENMAQSTQIKVPTLMIVGAEDHVVDNLAAKTWLEDLQVPSRFETLDGCAHMIQRDYKWREVAAITGQWIRSLPQDGESSDSL